MWIRSDSDRQWWHSIGIGITKVIFSAHSGSSSIQFRFDANTKTDSSIKSRTKISVCTLGTPYPSPIQSSANIKIVFYFVMALMMMLWNVYWHSSWRRKVHASRINSLLFSRSFLSLVRRFRSHYDVVHAGACSFASLHRPFCEWNNGPPATAAHRPLRLCCRDRWTNTESVRQSCVLTFIFHSKRTERIRYLLLLLQPWLAAK